jgi:hypothetical protein
MLFLCGDTGDVLLSAIRLFLRRRTRFDTTIAAVVADASSVIFDDCGVVGIVDDRFVHPIYGFIVEEVPIVPAATFVTASAVTVAIVNAAVKSDMFSPIAFMVDERASVVRTPVARGPKVSRLRSFDPRSRHPVVTIVIVVGPVTGSPDIAVVRANGLLVNRKSRRAEADGNTDLPKHGLR